MSVFQVLHGPPKFGDFETIPNNLAAAQAAVVIDAQNVGSDLIFTYSGTIDLTGMMQDGQDLSPRQLIVGGSGAILSHNAAIDRYIGGTLPSFDAIFLSNGVTVGDDFAIFANDFFGVTEGYQSGDMISGTLTFLGESIASAGMTIGQTVTSTIASGDTFTLNVGTVSEVPLPASLPLLGGVLLGFGTLKRRKRS